MVDNRRRVDNLISAYDFMYSNDIYNPNGRPEKYKKTIEKAKTLAKSNNEEGVKELLNRQYNGKSVSQPDNMTEIAKIKHDSVRDTDNRYIVPDHLYQTDNGIIIGVSGDSSYPVKENKYFVDESDFNPKSGGEDYSMFLEKLLLVIISICIILLIFLIYKLHIVSAYDDGQIYDIHE